MAIVFAIEDEPNLRYAVREALTRAGHEVLEADSVEGARAVAQDRAFDAVVTDVNLGKGSGIDLVRGFRDEGFTGPIVVMTAFGSVENAVEAMKAGADDYLLKPVRLDELALQLDRLLETSKLRRRVRLYERLETAEAEQNEPIGESPAWRRVMDLAARIAETPGGPSIPPMLITGETGVGKGVIARWIHDHSAVADEPFVQVNCSALPPTLVESELFGHERGAFTDAKEAREGYFEMAEGGAIFLDEIGDMPLGLQAKLLLAVEDRTFRRVGGTRDLQVRARIIAATNHDLDQMVADGTFRQDLLYRLNVVTLQIPPLRERAGDALLIAEQMLRRFAKAHGREGLRLAEDARAAIRAHDWPGNTRELINALQRVAMLCEGDTVSAADIVPQTPGQPHVTRANGTISFDFEQGLHTANDVERELIVQALRHEKGNVSRAARLIGMQRSSLRYRIDRYELHELVEGLAKA